jgi:pre-rRNA-processing protein TSR4
MALNYLKKELAEDLDDNNNSEGLNDDLDALKENDYDKDFERFKKISAPEAEQVVRYERGGEPLWCTKYNKLREAQVPGCAHCGAKRIFEFQVTPQLLNYLKLDESKQSSGSIDWAGLYVYTCVRSCAAGTNAYATEFIYKQDFVS